MIIDHHLQADIETTVSGALLEDVGDGDLTADLIPSNATIKASVVVREDATLAGRPWAEEVFRQVDDSLSQTWNYSDGDSVPAESVLFFVQGPARSILTAERTVLNFLQMLSATATETSRYVDALAGTGCRILDTRKTIPHLRMAQKYAVTCGGGLNHRIGLFDAYLIKENHLAACGGIAAAAAQARALNPNLLLEIEVESIDQLKQAIDASVDRVLLDNFSLEQTREAVTLNNKRIQLEASGNITEESLVEIANTGVDFISIGALTKHLRAIDFSLRFL